MRHRPWFLLLLFVGTLSLSFWLNLGNPGDPNKKPEKPARIPDTKTVTLPKVPADLDWPDVDRATLEEYAEPFQDAKVDSFSETVPHGETLITEGYESETGTFVFTRLTPTVIKGSSSTADRIQLDMERLTIDLTGGMSTVIAPEMICQQNTTGILITNIGEGMSRWLTFSAKITPGGIHLEGSSTEKMNAIPESDSRPASR